jgi:predicted amidohydrolase YtcJ
MGRAPEFPVRQILGYLSAAVFVLAAPAGAQDLGVPDVVYHNAKVVTVDDGFSIAEAVAIRDGRIVAVGSDDEVRRLAASETRQVDLGGRTMLPGFYDNHVHVGIGGRTGADYLEVPTPEDLRAVLEEQAAKIPLGEWIVGGLKRPYFHMKMPSRWELDEIAPNHPVALSSGHKMSVNSLALQRAGITNDTPNPADGGWIVREDNGEASGVLFETPAQRLITRVIPKEEVYLDDDMARRNLRLSLGKFPAMGVTSVNVAGMRPNTFQFVQDVYEKYANELPRMTMQVRLSPGYDSFDDLDEAVEVSIEELEALGFKTGFGNDRLKYGAVKMSIDGGIAAPDFWSIDPYDGEVRFEEHGPFENPDFHGVTRIPAEALYPVSKRAHELGWQLGIHAIGDGAVEMVVDALDRILEDSPRAGHRHFVHHITLLPPEETLRKMAENDIIAASQPNFTYFNTRFMLAAVSGDRLQTQNPQRSLIDHGIRMSYGSDGLPHGPLLGMWAAVTRRGYDGKVYGAEEGVSVEEAIRFYTQGSAYMTFDEDEQGSIEVGKVADLVVLGEDILTVDPQRIRDIPVELTIIDGEEVFSGSHVEPYYQEPPATR